MARTSAGGVQASEIQDSTYTYAEDAEASDAYAIALDPAVASYEAGQMFIFKANTANTGAASLNVNGLGAKTIKKRTGSDLANNDIQSGSVVSVVYDGTNFQMISMLANAPAGSGDMQAATYDPAAKAEQLLGVSDILDEDDMVSDSATKVPSQQSVKAYVDASSTVDVVSNVAQDRILGRVTAGSGDSQELTAAQVKNLLAITASDVSDFDTEVSNNASVTANTAKLTCDTTNVTAAGALMDSEVDADLKTLALPANTTISTFGASLVDDADAATARTTLGVDASGTDNSTDVTLAGTGTYISIAGQVITVDPITESDISDLGTYLENVSEDTTPQLGGELDAQANSIGFTMQTATGDGTTTVDWGNGNHMDFTFGAFNETFTFTAPAKPGVYTMSLKQDSVGSRTATWPASVKWAGGTAPTLTTTATTGYDLIAFRYDGTNYYGTYTLNFS